MKKYIIYGFILAFSFPAWASSLIPAKYCTSLLKAEEVGKICGRDNIKMEDKTMAKEGVNVCSLRYSPSGKNGWDVPRMSIHEFQSFTSSSSAESWLTLNKVSPAVDVSDIGDGAWLLHEKESDRIGFQSGRHYFELHNDNKFCSTEQIKQLLKIFVSRLPK